MDGRILSPVQVGVRNVNAEHQQQIYGGEIADYLTVSKHKNISQITDNTQLDDLSNVYENKVKGQPTIDTSGVINFNPAAALPRFERDPHFAKADQLLTKTLTDIAQQLGLIGDTTTASTVAVVSLQQQTDNDINTANNNVLQAMKELQDLGAI